MHKSDDEMLADQLEDLLDDYSYKCEELEKNQSLTRRAACYLELILIQQELRQVVERLNAEHVTRSVWEIAQEIVGRDTTEFHREAVRLLAESCEELRVAVSHAVASFACCVEGTAGSDGRVPRPHSHLLNGNAAASWNR